MTNYYRLLLGFNGKYVPRAYNESVVGANFGVQLNLLENFPDTKKEFNKKFGPLFLSDKPDKTKIAAGLAGGILFTIANEMQTGDVVLCPTGDGNYYVGEISGEYQFHQGDFLPHRRPVNWHRETLARSDMSDALKSSSGSPSTLRNISHHREELAALISGDVPAPIVSNDETIEDPSIFALEAHLEEFLVNNWSSTELGKKYELFEEEGELVGQQYVTDTGPIDILAISKDQKEIAVIELKKGRASDSVVGQVQRYMGFVKEELAEKDQTVRGIIVAFEDDVKIRRALSVAVNIDFYTYEVKFNLKKA